MADLASRVENVNLAIASVQSHLLSIGVCFCRLIVLHKFLIHVLQRDGALADATIANNNQLVIRTHLSFNNETTTTRTAATAATTATTTKKKQQQPPPNKKKSSARTTKQKQQKRCKWKWELPVPTNSLSFLAFFFFFGHRFLFSVGGTLCADISKKEPQFTIDRASGFRNVFGHFSAPQAFFFSSFLVALCSCRLCLFSFRQPNTHAFLPPSPQIHREEEQVSLLLSQWR